jgi:hypothetical protein
MAGLEVAASHVLARNAAEALLTGATTPSLSAAHRIEWLGSTTGLCKIPVQSGIILPRTAGGFGVRLYALVPPGAVAITVEVTMLISVGSIGSVTPPTFSATTFVRTLAQGGQITIDQDDAGAPMIEQLPANVAGAASMMALHGVDVEVTASNSDFTLFGVGVRAA